MLACGLKESKTSRFKELLTKVVHQLRFQILSFERSAVDFLVLLLPLSFLLQGLERGWTLPGGVNEAKVQSIN